MIQIGAVKLDDSLAVVDSISIPIRPVHYVKIHPRIRRMTQLGAEELADAPEFLEAMRQFVAWCGEDYALLTWGCDDVSVLKQNMDFFQCQEVLPPLCDIQKLYSDERAARTARGSRPPWRSCPSPRTKAAASTTPCTTPTIPPWSLPGCPTRSGCSSIRKSPSS